MTARTIANAALRLVKRHARKVQTRRAVHAIAPAAEVAGTQATNQAINGPAGMKLMRSEQSAGLAKISAARMGAMSRIFDESRVKRDDKGRFTEVQAAQVGIDDTLKREKVNKWIANRQAHNRVAGSIHTSIGNVDITGGFAGDPADGYKRGFGLFHAKMRRMLADGMNEEQVDQFLRRIPAVIKHGMPEREINSDRVRFTKDGHIVIVGKGPNGRYTMITSYIKKIMKGEDLGWGDDDESSFEVLAKYDETKHKRDEKGRWATVARDAAILTGGPLAVAAPLGGYVAYKSPRLLYRRIVSDELESMRSDPRAAGLNHGPDRPYRMHTKLPGILQNLRSRDDFRQLALHARDLWTKPTAVGKTPSRKEIRRQMLRSSMLGHERGIYLDPQGVVRFNRRGGPSSISVPGTTVDEMTARGGTFFHNHPSYRPPSAPDLNAAKIFPKLRQRIYSHVGPQGERGASVTAFGRRPMTADDKFGASLKETYDRLRGRPSLFTSAMNTVDAERAHRAWTHLGPLVGGYRRFRIFKAEGLSKGEERQYQRDHLGRFAAIGAQSAGGAAIGAALSQPIAALAGIGIGGFRGRYEGARIGLKAGGKAWTAATGAGAALGAAYPLGANAYYRVTEGENFVGEKMGYGQARRFVAQTAKEKGLERHIGIKNGRVMSDNTGSEHSVTIWRPHQLMGHLFNRGPGALHMDMSYHSHPNTIEGSMDSPPSPADMMASTPSTSSRVVTRSGSIYHYRRTGDGRRSYRLDDAADAAGHIATSRKSADDMMSAAHGSWEGAKDAGLVSYRHRLSAADKKKLNQKIHGIAREVIRDEYSPKRKKKGGDGA